MRRRRDGEGVERLESLGLVLDARDTTQAKRLDARVVVAHAERVVVARRDDPAAADTTAHRPLDRIRVFVGEADATEEPNALVVGLTVAQIGGAGNRLIHEGVLPLASVHRPRVVLGLGSQPFPWIEDEAPPELGEVLVERVENPQVLTAREPAELVLHAR